VLREEVFDLTVNAGCFYANGILVSNCDALRYVITDVYKATTVAKSPNKSRFEKKYGEGLSRWKPLL
jgi:hypothetical protein